MQKQTTQTVPFRTVITLGLMFFAVFMGAGNIIFPPLLGQQAGTAFPWAILGFLLTGVGLPALALVAVSRVGGLARLSARVGHAFGVVFTVFAYLLIGPSFGIPRTATVSYEVGVAPLLPNAGDAQWPLVLYALVFFIITLVLAANPTKIVDWIGKMLAPVLVLVIAVFAIKALISPLGGFGEPVGDYSNAALQTGFVQGYLTVDAVAALVLGILVVSGFSGVGVTNPTVIRRKMPWVVLVMSIGLSLVYISLGYIGATSRGAVGEQDNGGALLAEVSRALFGDIGGALLAAVIIMACLTTSIGLVSSMAEFFSELVPKVSYRVWAVVFSLIGFLFANVGLDALIALALPMLMAVYPVTLVLVLLYFFEKLFRGDRLVYRLAVIFTAVISVLGGLKEAGLGGDAIDSILNALPWGAEGLGWVVPALAGVAIGVVLHFALGRHDQDHTARLDARMKEKSGGTL